MKATKMTPDEILKIVRIADIYFRRKNREASPSGRWDGKKWFPTERERQPCCEEVRRPTRSFPYSLLAHCKTIKHLAALHSVDEKRLRLYINRIQVRHAQTFVDETQRSGRYYRGSKRKRR